MEQLVLGAAIGAACNSDTQWQQQLLQQRSKQSRQQPFHDEGVAAVGASTATAPPTATVTPMPTIIITINYQWPFQTDSLATDMWRLLSPYS